jgi:hypothetical protein
VSWDADLTCDCCGHSVGDWNYTHNTNGMIAAAREAIGHADAHELGSTHPIMQAIGPPWFDVLNGMSGAEGARYLGDIVTALEADPERYRAMNPENGWGSYDSLLGVLRDMRDCSTEAVMKLRTWRCSG